MRSQDMLVLQCQFQFFLAREFSLVTSVHSWRDSFYFSVKLHHKMIWSSYRFASLCSTSFVRQATRLSLRADIFVCCKVLDKLPVCRVWENSRCPKFNPNWRRRQKCSFALGIQWSFRVYRTRVSDQGKLSTPEEELHNCLAFAENSVCVLSI